MIFYFYGDNSYEIVQAVRQIKQQYEAKTGGLLDVTNFDMTETSLSDLVSNLAIQPMFAGTRLIIIRNLFTNPTAKSHIDDLIKAVPQSTVAIVVDTEADRRSSYFKHLSATKNAKEFRPLEPPKLREWIQKQVENIGGKIDSLTVQKLYDRVAHEYKPRDKDAMRLAGQDQWQLEAEIKKLVSYESEVTSESIDELVIPNIEHSIFELTDAVSSGRSDAALAIYQQLLLRGTSDQQILAMLNWQYRNLVLAKTNVGRDIGWAVELGINQYSVSQAERQADNFDMLDLKRAYNLMVEADLSIKTGEKPSRLALEELIYKLCQKN